ncbi:sulfite exporter TauE/SafE family protein, partial [candidate division KSB1 bacterium]
MFFSVSGIEVNPVIPPLVAFFISFFTSMAGVSGAFLLLPFQVSVLGFTSPAVSPTNLVYNIISIPSGVYRYIKEGKMFWPLAVVIIIGTLPGVFIGVVFRVKYLPDPAAFKLFVGIVLFFIGFQLLYQTVFKYIRSKNSDADIHSDKKTKSINEELLKSVNSSDEMIKTKKAGILKIMYEFGKQDYSFNPLVLFLVTLVVGIIGGAYGIGGGAIIAPFCIAVLHLPVYTVAGAALLGTFL